jgi:glutamate-5-semialdehyde dehydrogenase
MKPNDVPLAELPASPELQDVQSHVRALGQRARAASRVMAASSTAARNAALRTLASQLREQQDTLIAANQPDLDAATANGLAAPMVDRLKLKPAILETLALGCEQFAAMPELIGEVSGNCASQPSGIRSWADARAAGGVWHDLREPTQRDQWRRRACPSRAAMPASCAAAPRPLSQQQAPWPGWCSRHCPSRACPRTQCSWYDTTDRAVVGQLIHHAAVCGRDHPAGRQGPD